MALLECFSALCPVLGDAVGLSARHLRPVGTAGADATVLATGVGMAAMLRSLWASLDTRLRPSAGGGQAPDATPGIVDRLKLRYDAGYSGFATIDQIDKIMAERTQHFFGRDDQLAALDGFVRDNQRGILILAAPGGFGKSALLANWGRQRAKHGALVAYHFFNATAGRTTQLADALKGLMLQLTFLRGRPPPDLPDDTSKLEEMLNQELCQNASRSRPLIVILDGLDEAAETVPPAAPVGLGRYVYLLVSGRAEETQAPEHLAPWLSEARRVAYPILRQDMPQLSVEGVLAWVRDMVPGLSTEQQSRLGQRLAATGGGVPLFLQFIVDDIRDRHERGEALATIVDSLEALPAGFTDYAAQQLLAMRGMQGPKPDPFGGDVARVFALLTVVKGALPLDELQAVLDAEIDPWAFDRRITRWFAGRGAGADHGIAFLNPVLADVFRKALDAYDGTTGLLEQVRGRLVSYCRQAWSKGSLYALMNLPQHLIEAGQVRDAFAMLTDLGFLNARLGHAEAPALISRTVQDLVAAKNSASPDLEADIRAHRSFWANVEQRLLSVVRGSDAGSAPALLRQLLRDNPDTARRYVSGHSATWVQTAGSRAPPPLIRELKGHDRPVLGAIELGTGRLLSWSRDGTLRLWSADGTELARLAGHTRPVKGAAELPDGRLVSWSEDSTLRLWSSDGAVLDELRGHKQPVTGALVLSGRRLLSWSQDNTLRLWALNGLALEELTGHRDWVNGATALNDGRLLSWSDDGTLRLWAPNGAPAGELNSRSIIATIRGRPPPIGSSVMGAMQLTTGRMLSWGRDPTLRLWSPQGEPLADLGGHTDRVQGARELAGGHLLSWSADAMLRLWTADGAPFAELSGHRGRVHGALELSDRRLLSWGDDGALRLWAPDGAALAELADPAHFARGATVLKDGRLLSWSDEGALRLWTSHGAKLADLRGHGGRVEGAMALSDGRLLSWSDDGTLRLWDARAAGFAESKGHGRPVSGALVLGDRRLLSWSEDGTLRLWGPDGAALAELRGHRGFLHGALVLDNGRLLSWSEDGTLRLWTSEGAEVAELRGHSRRVLGALVLADGRLLSWSEDTTLRLWTGEGAPEAELSGHGGRVEGALALSDGRLLSWSDDGTLRLWSSSGVFLSLWLWPYAGITRVIPHLDPERPNVYWIVAGNDVLQVRHQPDGSRAVEERHEVVLSYAREDADIVRALHAELAAAHFSVWYDKDGTAGIAGGERFRDRIDAQIDGAKAVVVLWSQSSKASDWVLYEAARAHRQGKHIPLLLPPITSGDVPGPYSGVLDMLRHAPGADLADLRMALARKGVKPR